MQTPTTIVSGSLQNNFQPTLQLVDPTTTVFEVESHTDFLRKNVPCGSGSLPIHAKIYEKLDYFYKSNKIPHIIFHGSSGSGKRTIVDNFILKIYQNDKHKIKTNVMLVNCAHGKGIKFIREELKFFAKTNIQSNNGSNFKSIVLLNADYLTIDAQSALRRCIELFSYNTRFFIIVENKQKLLNPILSRFCEIYIPEYMQDGVIQNLHQYTIKTRFSISSDEHVDWVRSKMETLMSENITHKSLTELSTAFYANGKTCLDLINWTENTDAIDDLVKSSVCMCFDKIKSEFRCEKLLLLYLLDFIFLRSDKDVKCVSTI